MKPSSRCALAACCLTILVPSFSSSLALAGAPAFAGHAAMGHGAANMRPPAGMARQVQGPAKVIHGIANQKVGRVRLVRPPVRFVHRFLPAYGGYAPYYAPAYQEALPEQQPAAAPVVVETTPVNIVIGGPANQFAAPQACNGPKIVELGKPRETPEHLPRIIYGTPLTCVAAPTAQGGPGIYYLD